MTYSNGRLIHDADSHLMELDDCLDSYFDSSMLSRFHASSHYRARAARYVNRPGRSRAAHADPVFRAGVDESLLLRKNHEAHGSFIREDRSHAMDLFGFASQLVFTTYCLGNFGLDQTDDMALCFAAADAHNRMMVDFCAIDRRLLSSCYVPLEDFARARQTAELALRLGACSLLVPSRCPMRHAPSHVELDPVWAMAQEAGIPILFHVGGEEKMSKTYKVNGGPPVQDFHGGDDNFTSISYMPIPNSAMQTLSTLIFDGVFDRFPRLKWGAIELGAAWVPGWMRSMDSAALAFRKNEIRLQKLSALPSEIARRQLRVTPYPHEDTGWIIRNSGEKVCLFSSDFPHIEGGRHPIKRFDEALQGCSATAVNAFYADNFIDLMGEGLAPEFRRPVHLRAAA